MTLWGPKGIRSWIGHGKVGADRGWCSWLARLVLVQEARVRVLPPELALLADGLALRGDLTAPLGAGDQFVGRLVLGDEAGLHAEVARLWVVGDYRHRRLLWHHGVAVGEGHAD